MIIKNLTRKSGGSKPLISYILRYIFKPEKSGIRSGRVRSPYYERNIQGRTISESYALAMRSANVSFNKDDINHLLAEKADSGLLEILKDKPDSIPIHTYLQGYFFDKQYNLVKREPNRESAVNKDELFIKHNVKSNDINGISNEFSENNASRKFTRHDQTQIHHTIISWSNKDTEHLTKEMVENMIQHYIQLRGTDNMYCGTWHRDKHHIHAHIAMGTAQVSTRLSSRVDKKKFSEIALSMQAYQMRKFPVLKNSIVDFGKSKREKTIADNKPYIKTRTNSDVQNMRQCIERHYKDSHSTKEFLDKIRASGYQEYSRNGKQVQGFMCNGLRHRATKFDFEEKWEALRKVEEREAKLVSEFETIKGRNDRTIERETESQDIELELRNDDYDESNDDFNDTDNSADVEDTNSKENQEDLDEDESDDGDE